MQKLTINREDGHIAKSLPGQDHISGLLFLVDSDSDIPEEFATEPFQPCSDTKTASSLGLDTETPYGIQVLEAIRLNPGLSLYVGFALRTDNYAAVADMQHAAGGNIRQLGIIDTEPISKANITALQAQATSLDAQWMPLSIIVAPPMTDIRNLPTKVASSAPNVSVLISRDSEATLPAIGTLIGILSARKVNESIAWVERCDTGLTRPIFSDNTPYDTVDAAALETLDTERYIYLRTYPGLAGVYFSDSHNMSDFRSDYNTIELQRTMDKAVRGVRNYLLPQLGRPIHLNDDGTLRADILRHLETTASKAVDDMEKAGEVSGWKVTIDPAQDILATNNITFTIHAQPVGVMRQATVNIGFVKNI